MTRMIIEGVPSGWYKKIKVEKIDIGNGNFLKRTDDGTTIQYWVSVFGVESPVPKKLFLDVADKTVIQEINEYYYVDENYKTYFVDENLYFGEIYLNW